MEHLLVFLCLAFPHFIHISGSHSSVEKANNEKAEHESLHVMPEPKAFPARRITLAINELNVENCTSYFINITYLNGTKANYTAFRINITDTGDKRLVLNGNNVTIHGNDTSGLIRVFVRSNGTTGGFSILIFIASEVDGGKITIHPLCTPAFVGKHDKMGETGFYNFGILSGVESQPPLPPQLNIMSSAGELKSDLLYFSKGKYETSVAENEDPGTVLLIISAINTNTEDIYVFYKIIDQQPPTPLDAFSINSSTGHIVLLKTLDYAGNKYFDIVVEASVGNSSTLSSTANVRINVLEIRENCLKFSQAKYNVSVQENIPEGSIIYILNVTCRSKDGLFEGYFTVNSSMFRVERNAVIYLERGELDRERSPEIILEVWAFDGELSKLNSSAIVIVTLLDVNDNNPEFQNQTITFSILEGDYLTDSPVFLGEVEVEDLDVGLNGQINITSFYGGEDGRFIVLQNGTILVHGVLDRESKDRYLIPLMASDRGKPPRKSFAFALILIQDVNDNAPTFTQKEHFAHIVLADASYGDPVITVSARDLDAENNSHILYRFPHEYSGFTINGQTGQICLSRNFSAITMDSAHSLLVIASDLGSPSLSSTVTVFVTVSMNNTDLGLQFADSFYSFTVPEDLSERSEVGAVHAITGKTKAPLTYLLITYSEIFSITDNGQILTRVVLDREDQEEYNVLVEATDSQEPPDTAAVTVTVTVTDVNDNTPVFSPMVHTYFTCQENKDRIDIGTMTATDLDTGNNGSVAYALGNDFNRIFHIDNSTGELTTTKALDRETASSYNVTVVAADMGTPPLSSTIVLHIAVGDLNDNPPVFSEKSFAITMKENEPPQVVLNVSAVDIDIGYNAVILYSFIKSAPLFYIGRHSGSISTLQSLDYESAKEYVLKVIAYNPSDPQHRGTATVIVTVEDVNEVAPRPQYPIYNRIIKDSASIAGLLVCDINATDEEGNVDQGLHYSVTDGNTGGLFAISNSTGHIFLIKGLPEQNSKVPYTLTVMITDSGIPPLSAFVKVYITIIPNNTSSPVFSTDIYRPNPLSGQSLPTTFLVQVYALYSEPLRYNIVAGNDQDYFTMDPVTGVIITKKVLKKEDFPRNITVMAADPRDSDTFAEATVHVSLEEKNNATPSFPNNLVEVTVKEEQPSPLFITQLEATLNGTGRKEPLMYSLLNGSTKNFSINPTNGKLYAMTTFDYENGPIEYQIVLLAEDDGSAENNKGYCTVVIYILDINDWKPVFEPVENMVIVENALSGTIVGKVTATDRDTGNNAFIAYSLYDESNQFEIDRLLGNIFVKGRLDYETKNMSVLIVTATNNKTAPFYQTSKNVSVKILDQNDNAPKFTQKQYFAEFDANSPVGTRILVVNATDKDQGVNGDVEYFLIAESMPSNYFLVKNVKSGKIITSSSQLQPGLFNISVLAKDRGSPPLNDTASIIINIIHRPRSILGFNMNEISTTINRQEDGNHLVYTFAASNPEGKNIIYKIVAGNDLGLFTLDEKTGQLWTTDKLKYKTQPAYNITVAAIETPHLSSPLPVNMAQLEIFIRNATEELVFEKHLYKVKISNPVPFMFPVIRVKALELGEKYSIMYSLVNQTGNEFDINRNTGEIFIVSLNGKTGLYELKVQARDQAGLSDQTTVQVTVDSSSSSSGNAVEIKINQTLETVRRKLQGIVRILEDILHQNVSIKDLVTNYLEDNRSIETSIKFQALDKNDQAVDPATSAKKLSESKQSMQQKLENLFGQPVKISISEHRALMEGYGVLAASLMGALLGCVILVSSIIIWKRNKSRNGTSATRNMLDRNLENGHTGNHNGDPGDLEKGKKLKDPGNSEASQPVPPIPPIPPVSTIPSVKEVEQIEEEPSDLIPMEEDTSIKQTQNVAAKKKEEIVSKDEVTSESEEDTCQSAAFSKEGKTQTPVVSAEKIEGDLSKVQRTSDSQEDMFQSSAYSKEGCIPETTETQTWTKEQNGDEKEITVGEPFDLKITLPQIEEPEISEPCLIDDPPELEESKNKQLPEVVEETQVEYVETWESYESDDSEPDKITSKDMESETTENIPESAEQKQKIPDETEVTTQVTIMGRGSKSE